VLHTRQIYYTYLSIDFILTQKKNLEILTFHLISKFMVILIAAHYQIQFKLIDFGECSLILNPATQENR
jgi:hypothetical protein